MAWRTPKTNWGAADVPLPDDFNRIEGNVQELQNTKETPAGAQAKANTAEANAKAYTDAHEQKAAPHSGHATTVLYTATLNTTWSGSSAPYSKVQTVAGILATDTPIIDIVLSGAYATDIARLNAWKHVYRAVTSANIVTFYADVKPTVELPVQIKVVR